MMKVPIASRISGIGEVCFSDGNRSMPHGRRCWSLFGAPPPAKLAHDTNRPERWKGQCFGRLVLFIGCPQSWTVRLTVTAAKNPPRGLRVCPLSALFFAISSPRALVIIVLPRRQRTSCRQIAWLRGMLFSAVRHSMAAGGDILAQAGRGVTGPQQRGETHQYKQDQGDREIPTHVCFSITLFGRFPGPSEPHRRQAKGPKSPLSGPIDRRRSRRRPSASPGGYWIGQLLDLAVVGPISLRAARITSRSAHYFPRWSIDTDGGHLHAVLE
jgi:hypothetical protein